MISDQWPVASGQQGTDELTTDHRPPTTGHSPLEEWEVPRQRPDHWPPATEPLITEYWKARIARQREIDGSIARNADYEYLYYKPYEDKSRVRVAGPFTVESVSPHRVLAVDENGEFVDGIAEIEGRIRRDHRLRPGHPRESHGPPASSRPTKRIASPSPPSHPGPAAWSAPKAGSKVVSGQSPVPVQ